MKSTLLILAAGMGSRYGGLKQLDSMGPNGETLLDYSVFDAIRAGYDRVAFVIRKDFEDQFRQGVGARFENHVEVAYAFQDLKVIPGGFQTPATREKPWGTGHAIWSAREIIDGPFAAINADDFYGADAYRVSGEFLKQSAPGSTEFAMVGYPLGRTLSEHGSVSRGICVVDGENYLQTVVERTKIERVEGGGAQFERADGTFEALKGDETVSMNFWCFSPAVFPLLEKGLIAFLEANLDQPKAEYYIPSSVAEMIDAGTARVRVLPTEADWFGVTYREDRPKVVAALGELADSGKYPSPLWK